ncbi:MAG: hypothetical protein MHM6MM_001133 [Cercozoa sp. M6MM]
MGCVSSNTVSDTEAASGGKSRQKQTVGEERHRVQAAEPSRQRDSEKLKQDSPASSNKRSTMSVQQFEALPEDYKFGERLKTIPILSQLTDRERAKLASVLTTETFANGEAVINQGDMGDKFFFIIDGTARVSVRNEEGAEEVLVAELEAGDYFGEAALVNRTPRSATVSATSELRCVTLDSSTFKHIFGPHKYELRLAARQAISAEAFQAALSRVESPSASHRETEKSEIQKDAIRMAITSNVLFGGLDEVQLEQIVDEMFLCEFDDDAVIIQQNDYGDCFYVLEQGAVQVEVRRDGHDDLQLFESHAPYSFGELALMYNAPRQATVRAKGHCVAWAIGRRRFRNILFLSNEQKQAQYEELLKKCEVFSSLLSRERTVIADLLEESHFAPGQIVFKQGDEPERMYIVRSGTARVVKDGECVAELHRGQYFGEMALMNEDKRAATVQASDDSALQCLSLNKQAFTLVLGPLGELLQRGLKEYESKGPSQRELRTDIPFERLHVIGTLGKGAFGHVQLVEDEATREMYALKMVFKQQIVDTGQQEHIMNEKNAMISLNHPLLVNLHATYNRGDKLFFLLDACFGGELFTLLRRRGLFDEPTARFYAAHVVLLFEHMHERGIIYRDLKPENLLMDKEGYLRLTDFGFAKTVYERTFTLCGTPDYLAPEIISGRGHNRAVDCWTLGILVYEMLASYCPFYDNDQMRSYQKIMAGRVRFPSHMSKEAIDLIRQLLHPKPSQRLGMIKGGWSLVKQHPWFSGFDWTGLLEKRLVAPIKPRVLTAARVAERSMRKKTPSYNKVYDTANDAAFEGF